MLDTKGITNNLLTLQGGKDHKLKYIDLFAGLGGFHIALNQLGAECVMACELDAGLRTLYDKNFGITPLADIRNLCRDDVPAHDILCAGFPCQSFSKAGAQQGFSCTLNGDLIHKVIEIVQWTHPTYLMLENVPNLAKHDKGATWSSIKNALEDEGYEIEHEFYSPHEFGIPQIRQRMFIVGSRKNLNYFAWPRKSGGKPCIKSVLIKNPTDECKSISVQLEKCLKVWQRFLELFPEGQDLPSFPIWTMEFGADYPITGEPPTKLGLDTLRQFKGACGASLDVASHSEALSLLPSYATNTDKPFPRWKTAFIKQNRDFYIKHKDWMDELLPEIRQFPPSYQKFEWNCKGEVRDLWQLVLQVRASGIRVKRATTAPSLVAMTTSQVPIIGWERRYMTPRECARLQSIPSKIVLPQTPTASYKALGNAVNVELVKRVAKALVYGETDDLTLFNYESDQVLSSTQ